MHRCVRAFNIQRSIWENIEHLYEAEILKEYPVYSIIYN